VCTTITRGQAELARATSLAEAADTGALGRLRGELAEAEAARSEAEAAREAAAAETIDVEAVMTSHSSLAASAVGWGRCACGRLDTVGATAVS
jgi:hypothetical protein